MTLSEHSNHWRGISEDTVMKRQQQGPAVPNSDSVKPSKPLIPDKYNNRMNLKKLKRIKYSTKALLELRAQGFSEEELAAVPILQLQRRSLLCDTKHCPLIEKVMRCTYNSIMETLIWNVSGKSVMLECREV